jgi:hypothetical protein
MAASSRAPSSRSTRIVIAGVFVATVAIGAVVLGLVLIGHREWMCTHRYWSDGRLNREAVVPTILGITGVAVGLCLAVGHFIGFLRSGRMTAWLLPAGLGLLPLALILIVFATGYRGYDCSTG